jgi:hypothetical protein
MNRRIAFTEFELSSVRMAHATVASILKLCVGRDLRCHGQLACPCPAPRTGGHSRQWHPEVRMHNFSVDTALLPCLHRNGALSPVLRLRRCAATLRTNGIWPLLFMHKFNVDMGLHQSCTNTPWPRRPFRSLSVSILQHKALSPATCLLSLIPATTPDCA